MSLWDKIFLKEVSSIMYGYTAKASLEIDGPKYLRITDIQNQTVKWEDVPNCQIDKDFEKYSLKKGDIVFARTGATTGKSFLISSSPDAVFASYLIRVQINTNRLLPEFLYKYFQTQEYWDLIEKGTTGSAQGGFNATKLGELGIPIPPIPEQKRIVEILDEAFEAIDQAKANIEKNIQNAEELFQSKLNEIFSQKGEGWEEKRFVEIADLIDSLHKTPKYTVDGYSMVRVTDINSRFLDLSNTKKVDENTFIEFSKRHTPRIGDIIFSRVGSYGKSTLINKVDEPFCLGQNTVYILPKINSTYLYYFLNSPICKEQIDKLKSGTTQPTVSLKSIRSIIVPIPSGNNQNSIVGLLDKLIAIKDEIRTTYEHKLYELLNLKKSILQKAFSGELTANEELVV